MNPIDVTPATVRLLMLAATPDQHPETLRDALAAFDDIPSCTHLATTLATHIAGKLQWTPLAFDLDQPAQMLAFAMARHATENGSLYLTEFIEDLAPTELAAVCIALLQMWATACDAATTTALRQLDDRGWDTPTRSKPSKAPQRPEHDSRGWTGTPNRADKPAGGHE